MLDIIAPRPLDIAGQRRNPVFQDVGALIHEAYMHRLTISSDGTVRRWTPCRSASALKITSSDASGIGLRFPFS
jgi:hypothetical protein